MNPITPDVPRDSSFYLYFRGPNSSLYSPLKLAVLKSLEGAPNNKQIDHDIGGEAVGHTTDRAEQVRGGNGDRVHSIASPDPSAANIEVLAISCAVRVC